MYVFKSKKKKIEAIYLSSSKQSAIGSGVFELKVLSLENPLGRDSTGECCVGPPSPGTGQCNAACPARLRACLKHYQAQVDTTSPCTFGDLVTPVLGNNSLHLEPQGHLISFQFDFTWPVSTHYKK